MRRYKSFEFKLSLILSALLAVIIPPKVTYMSEWFRRLDYGGLCDVFTITQNSELTKGAKDFVMVDYNFDLLSFAFQVILVYGAIILVENLYIKFKRAFKKR